MDDDAKHAGVLDELRDREPIFHRLELGTTRADFEAQTAPDFWEVGASGQTYDREVVWSVLADRYANPGDDPWETTGFRCRALGADTYLLTYLLRQDERLTRRATICDVRRMAGRSSTTRAPWRPRGLRSSDGQTRARRPKRRQVRRALRYGA